MTEDELTVRIADANDAIYRILKLGKEYEVGSGPTKRIFKAENIKDLREYIADLNNQLLSSQGNSGCLVGF